MATVMMLSFFFFIVIDFIMTNAKTLRIENLYQKVFFKVNILITCVCCFIYTFCCQEKKTPYTQYISSEKKVLQCKVFMEISQYVTKFLYISWKFSIFFLFSWKKNRVDLEGIDVSNKMDFRGRDLSNKVDLGVYIVDI